MVRSRLLVLAFTVCATHAQAQPTGVVPIDADAVEAHVRDIVPPVYPPLAAAARVEGTVTVSVIVSTAGTVEAAQATRSIPVLDQSAIDAVKQWRFMPFEVSGQPVRAVVEVDVPFYLEQRTARLAADVQARSRDCRALLAAKRLDQAEVECAAAANIAAKLPAPDRAKAYHLVGQMLVARGLLPRAIDAFKAEIELRGRGGDEGAIASAHQSLAGAYAASGDVKNAQRQYEQAEKSAGERLKTVERTIAYTRAEPAIAEFLRTHATALLRSVLTDYVDALHKAGLDADAARVQQRLDRVAATVK